jgi:serine/threonine protein kinase/tetratricopeptide (TPR) repeat protein
MKPGDDVQSVVEAIADGAPVRWPDVHQSADLEASGPVMRELRVLAALADVHRSPDSGPDVILPIAEADQPTGPDGTPSYWGPFRLLGQIGRGTFGAVYRAWDARLDREVALKLLRRRDERDPASPAAVAEGRLLAKLRHPNIITVYGAEVIDGTVGIWMELLRGRTLQQELNERGAFSAHEAALVGIDLSRALAAVHGAGLVHRDVKAQNVMREQGGRIVLMDFGAGRDLESSWQDTVSLTGTPLYMAPELFDEQRATPSSDRYSLGVLLYHLVTNAFPVVAPTVGQLKEAHGHGDRRRLRDVRPDLPLSFIQAVEGATAADPAGRTPDAATLEADLERVIRSPAAGTETGRRRRLTWRTVMPVAVAVGLMVALAWNNPSVREYFAPRSPSIRSIAVLPFANLSGQADQEHLADGMTELLIGRLSRLSSVNVTSRTSAMSYKGKQVPLGVIARELGRDAVVEGSISRSGDRLRVSVQLLRADESRVWGQDYERPAADLFVIQGEIAGMIAEAIHLSMTPAERRTLTSAPIVQVQAQDAYLRGLQHLNAFTNETLELALADLQEAVRLDSGSARAYAALSQCYLLLGGREILKPADAYVRAQVAATRAVQLDDTIAEAHTELAEVKFYHEWDWEGARLEYERALALNPNGSHAMARYSLFLSALGRSDDALKYATAAQRLDPISATVRFAPGMALYYAGRFPEAVDAFTRLDTLPPFALYPSDRIGLGRAYAAVGRYPEAIQEIERAINQEKRAPGAWVAELARIEVEAGRAANGTRRLKELTAPGARAGSPANLAFIYAALGDRDRAFAELERAVDQRSATLLWANVDPRLASLRSDARFQELLEKIGLRR